MLEIFQNKDTGCFYDTLVKTAISVCKYIACQSQFKEFKNKTDTEFCWSCFMS